ncbi:hypothetical protein [Deinococcus hopiensis]|uniref:DUF4397 domain-containing protein n=1 Tax=Deinococcus hopiensis KR-140 TaxID=695939 RepID=A0A1W1UAN5_9DEIO|nr:hypothetical protein [Deinococcus hopiensis]SMB77861.1 hypothetical protein SAMN00790413_03968 [Deinococcus hopiensis KR-140]
MRHIKAILLSTFVAATTLTTGASATPVYFHNDSGASGVVDVYVNGQLVFDDVFPDNSMMFPKELLAGEHEVVVTPNYLKPGEQDLMRTTLTVPEAGFENYAYTMTFSSGTDGVYAPALSLE